MKREDWAWAVFLVAALGFVAWVAYVGMENVERTNLEIRAAREAERKAGGPVLLCRKRCLPFNFSYSYRGCVCYSGAGPADVPSYR